MLDSAPQYPVPSPFERCLDLIFPPLCVECRRVGRWICTRCWTTISWLGDARCGVCGSPSGCTPCPRCADHSSSITSVLAVAAFEGVAREAVHALKYEGKHAIAPMMGRLMARAAYELEANLVVATPLHAARRRERGYDQAALLARAIARELQLSSDVTRLKRVTRTKQQVRLGPEERRQNVSGAFQATRPLHGETVLLVDDVYTTGATIDAAAAALLEGGAGSVLGVVFGYAEFGQDAGGPKSNRRNFTASRPNRSTR
jgi:ComF family protein